jgi:hypothetical protein
MEALTRLVSQSLARHGFDRPLDYRRLHWSRWFRCESLHSLLLVPSKPGVFAIAEEIMDLGSRPGGTSDNSPAFQRREDPGNEKPRPGGTPETDSNQASASSAPSRRLLAVIQFFEDDDMAFVLDRMMSRPNPLRDRLNSGRYFVRFVVIEDPAQRRSICTALNQWMVSAAEKATGIGSHFASSLELTPEGNETWAPQFSPLSREVGISTERSESVGPHVSAQDASSKSSRAAPHLDSGAAANTHCPSPFPSGF